MPFTIRMLHGMRGTQNTSFGGNGLVCLFGAGKSSNMTLCNLPQMEWRPLFNGIWRTSGMHKECPLLCLFAVRVCSFVTPVSEPPLDNDPGQRSVGIVCDRCGLAVVPDGIAQMVLGHFLAVQLMARSNGQEVALLIAPHLAPIAATAHGRSDGIQLGPRHKLWCPGGSISVPLPATDNANLAAFDELRLVSKDVGQCA